MAIKVAGTLKAECIIALHKPESYDHQKVPFDFDIFM